MNRTAKCIRMLVLLRTHGVMSTTKLAQALETNPRNIREFRKELEEVGYSIQSVRGPLGGYFLDSKENLFPLPALNSKQAGALHQIRDYVDTHPGLNFGEDAVVALDSVLSQINRTQFEEDSIYFLVKDGQDQCLNSADAHLKEIIEQAMKEKISLELSYLSISSSTPKTRKVDPYVFIKDNTRLYLCGYDHSHKEYCTYLVSSHRMVDLYKSFDRFDKDKTFQVQDHIGTNTLIKSEMEQYLIQVKSDQARFVEEQYWGKDFKKQEDNKDYCTYSFSSSDSSSVLSLLTRFGPRVRLLEPKSRVREYVEKLREILSNYD